MTDIQLKYQANQIAEEANRINAEKAEETKRANLAKEAITDLENLAKYGYTKYQPGTDTGYWAKSNAQGVTNVPFDLFEQTVGKIIGSLSPLGKLL